MNIHPLIIIDRIRASVPKYHRRIERHFGLTDRLNHAAIEWLKWEAL